MRAESDKNLSQHQKLGRILLDSTPRLGLSAWETCPKRESGSNEFPRSGHDGHRHRACRAFQEGAPRLYELPARKVKLFPSRALLPIGLLLQDVETSVGRHRIEVPWPGPKMQVGGGAINGLADVYGLLGG